MPLNVGDYLRDTTHLTTEQHGAYLLLIFHYWTSRGPLVDDDRQLATIAKLSRRVWANHRPILAGLFRVAEGLWRHKRVEEEIATANRLHEDAKAAADERWRRERERRGPTDASADASARATAYAEPHAGPMQRTTRATRTTGATSQEKATATGCDPRSTRKETSQSRDGARAREAPPADLGLAGWRSTVLDFLVDYHREGGLSDEEFLDYRDRANRAASVDDLQAIDEAAIDLIEAKAEAARAGAVTAEDASESAA